MMWLHQLVLYQPAPLQHLRVQQHPQQRLQEQRQQLPHLQHHLVQGL
jgi:hypothetical protein